MRNIRLFEHTYRLLLRGLALLLFLLAACGTNASAIASGNSPRATATKLPVRHCGTVHTLGQQVVVTDQKSAKDVENCFWQAYQHCHSATLVYSQGGVDTATIHTFSLKSQNGKCAITDTLQHVIFPRSPTPSGNDTCAKLTQQSEGLHFLACKHEGDVLLPV